MTTWKIINMERHIENGIVYIVHWIASLQEDREFNQESIILKDKKYYASSYGSIGLQAPEENIIAYENLTEEIVIEWIKTVLDTEFIETSLLAQIELQKNPPTATGLPW
jgi:hypothetical protein